MATFEMYTHLCSVLSISAEHLFHALRLLQQLAHGALVLRDVIGRFLLGVKEPGEVIAQSQSDFKASQVAIEAVKKIDKITRRSPTHNVPISLLKALDPVGQGYSTVQTCNNNENL